MTDTIEKLEKDICGLALRLEAFKAEDKTFPQIDAQYWHIYNRQVVTDRFFGTVEDQNRQATGNLFCTKQEAQSELDCQLVEHEMRCCEGRVDNNKSGAIIIIDSRKVVTTYASKALNLSSGLFGVFFASGDYAEKAAEKVGKERILAAAKWKAERPVY